MNDSKFVWDKSTKRFRNISTGTFVSAIAFRNELDNIVDNAVTRVKKMTEALRVAENDLPEWQMQMTMEVKYANIAFASAAHGGFNNMTANDYERVSETIDHQLQYLQKFAEDIYTGKQTQNNSMTARASLYMEAARATYENERSIVEQDSGSTLERNILAAGDNCNGCIDATGAGWVTIGTLSPIGGRECQSRCRCYMEYK